MPGPAGPASTAECVKVVVRCRPLNSKEVAEGRQRIVDVDTALSQVLVKEPAGADPPKAFTFDSVFDWNCSQQTVYEQTALPIVDSVLEGYNGTVFAYGQTGTGKTHTMDGGHGDTERGIIPKAFGHIFDAIQVSENHQFLVRASFLEIYNEEVRDLLSKNPKNKLDLKEHSESGVYVKELNSFVVKSVQEITSVLEVGKKNRSVGATLMNQDSSRSHSIFTITVERLQQGTGEGSGHVRVGKLNLVDLAGSERQSKTGATGDRLKEATKINLSLSALGNVISALVDGKPGGHVPYRDSKLTRLLQDSLGGNTKTVMIANIGPADYNFDETVSSLRYANRAKNIKNKPRINEDPKDAMLREFQEEILRLKAELQAAAAQEGVPAEDALEEIVERRVERPLSAEEVEAMRAHMERDLREQLVQRGAVLDPETLAKIHEETEQQAQREAAAVAEQHRKATEEAAQLEAAAQQQAASLHQIQEQRATEARRKAELEARLARMQSKLLCGEEMGGLAAAAEKKQQLLAARQREWQAQKDKEAAKAQRIVELEQAKAAARGKFSSLQDEAAQLTQQLRALMGAYTQVKSEVDAHRGSWQAEKEVMMDSARMLQQQLALKDLVIQAFIPPPEVQKLMKRAHWDEEQEVWVLQRLSDVAKQRGGAPKRPVSAAGARRPVSAYAKAAAALGDHNPRYKTENILNMELDMPERTTFDFGGPSDHMQAALDAAFGSENHVTVFLEPGKQQNIMLADEEVLNGLAMQPQQPSRSARPPSAIRRPRSARGRAPLAQQP